MWMMPLLLHVDQKPMMMEVPILQRRKEEPHAITYQEIELIMFRCDSDFKDIITLALS